MTDAIVDPAGKAPAAPLNARAARPMATRLRGTPVKVLFAGATLVLAGAFVYSFVLHPGGHLPTVAKGKPDPDRPAAVRPAARITSQPASYGQTAISTAAAGPALPDPRTGSADPAAAPGPVAATSASPAAAIAAPLPAAPMAPFVAVRSPAAEAARDARRSGVFFSSADAPRSTPQPERIFGPATLGDAAAATPISAVAQADYDASYGRHVLIAPLSPFEAKAGTIIPAALLTMVDTGRPGPVVAVTTEPVFDTVTGRTLLIPQGSKLIGVQAGDSAYGEKRAFLVWKRLILPNGKSLLLEDQAATDAAGATGVPGRADRRLLQLGGAIALSGAITSLGEIARSHDNQSSRSLIGDVGDATAVQAVQVGGRLVDRELNVQPKIVVRAGAPVQVLLTKDLVLEPAS